MNSSIKAKLFGGFSILLLLLVSAVLLVMNALSDTNDRLNHLVSVSAERKNLSNKILVGVLQASRHEKNIILENDLIEKRRYRAFIEENKEVVDKNIGALRLLLDGNSQQVLNRTSTVWNNYLKDLDEIISLAMRSESEAAFNISIDRGAQVRETVVRLVEQIIDENEANMAKDVTASNAAYQSSLQLIIFLIVISVIVSGMLSYWIVQSITRRIAFITAQGERIASREFFDDISEDKVRDELSPVFYSLASVVDSFRGITNSADKVASGNYSIDIEPKSDKDILGLALRKMVSSLRETTAENQRHSWLTSGQNQLNEQLRGDKTVQSLASNVVTFLCGYLNAHIGAIYIAEGATLELAGTYAFPLQGARLRFAFGEGLPGQVARERKLLLLEDVEDKAMRIASTAVDAGPKNLVVSPFVFEGTTIGVVEIGRLTPFTATELEFISAAMESIAISCNSAIARKRIQELLEETQKQSEELQTQQEELRQVNEELEEQAQNLKQQQEELQITNEELEEQTHALELKNRELESARTDIEQKSKQLEVSSKYKSEFLANMSHELRTPLNSLLILSNDLAENKHKNLSQDQVESAEIIYKSGRDLLALINEVLDLSKIEAGKMSINAEKVWLKPFADNLYRTFRHQAEEKRIGLAVHLADDMPDFVTTDSQRLEQILKNLLSNALKFTHQGSVAISISSHSPDSLAIAVKDTGIGIPEDKLLAVFEAFQQADGSTARKYGGTGLGLAISRELAKLLNGEIKVVSKVNEGSTFTVIIPLELSEAYYVTPPKREPPPPPPPSPIAIGGKFLHYPTIEDDKGNIQDDDKIVLIIEDDLKFASILLKQAHAKQFKGIAAATGEDGLHLADQYRPHAIILDLDLPGMSGHDVLSELKATPALRHIPVHIMSVNERSLGPIKEGAVEYLTKPVEKKQLEEAFNRIESFISRKMKNLLVVEDDANSRIAIRKLIGNGDVKCFEAETGQQALEIFSENHIDCIVLDLGLSDMTGFDFIYALENLKGHAIPPIIIYTGRELSREENEELEKYAETVIIKGVKSEERLLDETALFLHRTIGNLPAAKQRMITELYDRELVLSGKTVLLVDDDMRNVFALSRVLKERGMEVIKAENGEKALEVLGSQPGIQLILMDIMMPVMDGYEAMRRIRAHETFRHLPIIALTAKAMKEDRQKCIDAGANDYITKPVDLERLISLLRVWLSK